MTTHSQATYGRRVRACHITTVHPTFDVRIFFKECRSLAEAGFDVHLVACHDHDEVVDGVKIHALPKPPNRIARLLLWPIRAFFKAVRVGADIYHLHDPELVPLAVLLKYTTGATIIFDFHEDIAGQILTKFWVPKPLRWALSSAVRLLNSLALIGMGVIETDMIEDYYRQPKQSVRNLPLLDRSSICVRNRSDFEGPAKLVYVGGVSELRGAMAMLQLAAKLRDRGGDFELEIIGQPDRPELAVQMADFVRANHLTDCVRILGPKPYPEAMQAIRRATMGLCFLAPIPNYSYSLSTKILEYMAYGVPVVVSDVPCCRQYMEYTRGGLIVDLEDVDGIAEQTASLLGDPDRMLAISRRSQQMVLNELNWRHEARLLLRFYRRMIKGDIGPDPCWYHKPKQDQPIHVHCRSI
ncbi:MAG: glycosyltransferase family 4 protein [Phycisphaerae bacterium]|nr:glycosyltransferase family 4 protein [Phycisphaerae bacterium]